MMQTFKPAPGMGVRVVNKSTRQVLMTFYGGYHAIQAGNELRIVNKGTVVQKFVANLVEYNHFFILTEIRSHYHGDNAECVDAEFIVSSPNGDITTVELWRCKSCGEHFSKRTTQTRKDFEEDQEAIFEENQEKMLKRRYEREE